jgi:predicted TIM-barrel fold metal-dependent hydrolase
MKKILSLIIVCLLISSALISGPKQRRELLLQEGEISPAELLLKDYQPIYQLKVKETKIIKPKFPIIDIHMHPRPNRDPDRWVAVMDSIDVKKTVLLTGRLGEKFKEVYDMYAGKYPDRFIMYCGMGREWVEDSDYSEKVVAAIEEAYAIGARGIGEVGDKGFGLGKDHAGNQIYIDHPMFDPVWKKCGELRMPVNIHVFDPPAFYTPLDKHNEQFLRSARFHHYGRDYQSREVMIEKRNKILQKHKNTIFIGAHVGNAPHDLEEISKVLDENPNFYVDFSARLWELGRQPYTARRFLIKYQDRVLYGTDNSPDVINYIQTLRFTETDDEFFKTTGSARPWRSYGVFLPDEVLEKIYYLNAEKIVPGAK